ncbi:hypothetical protein [Phenylobacterium aquaticum]|uniref:hypothetical protein n=1 Tax=Phenylobacterium aquaticum TaxID=1763816 RepID=UPI001F5C8C6E|nr:hypothetical protein [Phenylobacterium aquaticum]MCI3134309.1 hypothetical protein [Phenylobacterium aquaticum]
MKFVKFLPETLSAALLAVFLGWAFHGLSTSSYWIDELFTLFVVDHHGGWSEVMARALTDTHPPAYYLALNSWIGLFGSSEVAVRSLSAICATGAVAVFMAGTRGVYSLRARLFAGLVAVGTAWWFNQSQNGRNYAFCMLASAVLAAAAVAIRRRQAQGGPFPARAYATLVAAGLIGSMGHFYMLLQTGMVFAALILTTRDRRLQAAVAGAGLVILAVALVYIHALRVHTLQNFNALWFGKDWPFFRMELTGVWEDLMDGKVEVALGGLLLALAAWRGRAARAPEGSDRPLGDWLAGAGLFAAVAAALLGVLVTLVYTPSFSDQNVLVAFPLIWPGLAWLYDAALGSRGPRWEAALGLAVFVCMALRLPLTLERRDIQRMEDWRGSAAYVSNLPACRGQDIPVVLPYRFGPSTLFFRRLAEADFFGRYYRGGGRLQALLPDELAGDPALAPLFTPRAHGGCPILAWSVHDVGPPDAERIRAALAARPELAGATVVAHGFPSDYGPNDDEPNGDWAYVYEVAKPAPPSPKPRRKVR